MALGQSRSSNQWREVLTLAGRPRSYRLTAKSYRHARADAFDLWGAYSLEMTA